MTDQFRSKFSFNIRLITVGVFITAAAFFMILVFGVAGYAQSPPPRPTPSKTRPDLKGPTTLTPSRSVNVQHAEDILSRVGKPAEDTFYSCILNGYMQGLPLKEALEKCSGQLIKDEQNGFGGDLGNIGRNEQQFFDPTKVSAACSSADSSIAKGGAAKPLSAEALAQAKAEAKAEAEAKALEVAEEAAKKKLEQAAEAAAKLEKKEEAADKKRADLALKKSSEELMGEDTTKTQAALDAAETAYQIAKQATDIAWAAARGAQTALLRVMDAESDAASSRRGNRHKEETREPSYCEEALQSAREILRECNRNGWKSAQCKQLKAKVNDCPDPTLILVDPDQGYACGAKPDAATVEALKKAWVTRCEENKKFGPDTNPCEPPTLDGRQIKGKIGDVCNDPHALVNPDSDVCAVTFHVPKTWGTTDIQNIIILGLNKLGGPIFVLPPRNPKTPGPAPPTLSAEPR